ncbi:uncharacterized protein BP01DRAFT_382295 [Aspergillus saccharolyticus JOP 1030-1]|uniref:Uncharacterized protein n=1 Tax=Aspergillus saccharolyticus JOP 1030-1 TaxID=1450539 RepID=A0A319AG19_9EURO|nr:hypothetical protein BP01DRAFT_382295 [Aspergillus saccharolyticus JOP 1030-1]PYH45672.1 hypothetical protein BP01DRAFT_382295 [Aspergillus saccharolyticus JOP 1030-1]
MYTETPSSRFLVLAPIHNGPLTAAEAQHPRERSSSQSSTTSNDSSRRPGLARLPSGFLGLPARLTCPLTLLEPLLHGTNRAGHESPDVLIL